MNVAFPKSDPDLHVLCCWHPGCAKTVQMVHRFVTTACILVRHPKGMSMAYLPSCPDHVEELKPLLEEVQ